MAFIELGAYHEPPYERTLIRKSYGNLDISLSPSQHEVLSHMVELANDLSEKSILVPLYVSADTGAGKSYLSLVASAVVAKKLSFNLSKLHSVYLSPTKFLASQMGERSKKLYESMKAAVGDVDVIEIRGDMPPGEKSRSVERAFSKLKEGIRLVLTNPQMLASIAMSRSSRYRIKDRVVPFNLISGLAEVDLYIVDEPHFYTGKSFIKFLTLLLEIGRWKQASALGGPTFILFISATMHPLSIEKAFRELEHVLGIKDTLVEDVPLPQRNVMLEDREAGEKYISFMKASNPSGILEILGHLSTPSVIYADNINLLVRLQERIKESSVILHSQMPKSLWDSYTEGIGNTDYILMTSVGEVGIELERFGVNPSSMMSINTMSVMKVIQRLGRIARRKESVGTFVNVDLSWIRKSLSETFSNKFRLGSDGNLPSFLEEARKYEPDFFTSYVSKCADREFHRLMMEIERGDIRLRVPEIYLSPSLRLRSKNDEELTLPLMKVASTVIPISAKHELKIWRSDLFDDLMFELKVRSKRASNKPLVRIKIGREKYDLQFFSSSLPSWLKDMGIREIAVKWREAFKVALPLLDGYTLSLNGPAVYFRFYNKRFGKNFRYSDEYTVLEENLYPASEDLDFIVPEGWSDTVLGYEPFTLSGSNRNYGVGAVEKALDIILGEKLNLKC